MTGLKLYLLVGAFVAAMAVGAGVAHSTGKARIQLAQNAASAAQAESKGLRTQLAAERASGAARAAHRAALAAQTKENHVQLETALGTSQDWRAVPVPAAVVDSLRDAARRANTGAPAE